MANHNFLWINLGFIRDVAAVATSIDLHDAFLNEFRVAHSIASSARASSVGGTSRPSVLAALRLITSSNFVGCSTGMSAGFAPFRIRAAMTPSWRYTPGRLVP